MNDTAIDVALEMVKELDIDDWEPLEIADMIEEEISSLVPTWKDWGSSQVHHQHSFKYEEDDEDDDQNEIRYPFYATFSHSSYEAQFSHGKSVTSKCNWPQGTYNLC